MLRRGHRTFVRIELVAHELDPLDAFLAENRHRRPEEAEDDSARLSLRLASRELLQNRDVALGVRALRLGTLELGGVDDDVRAGELPHLVQLGRRERRLRGAAATDDDDLADRRARDRRNRRVGRIRGLELFVRERKHPRHVERHVPVADHDGTLDREVEVELLIVGMAVVPGDELGRRPRAAQILAGNPEPSVSLRADRVDDGVVEAHEIGVVDVAPKLHVAEESEARLFRDPLERPRDRLQLRVIRRHPEPDKSPGRG